MRFYKIAGLCAFSLAVAAVCAVKKLKEKKHEAEETHGVYHKTVQEQETGQSAEKMLEEIKGVLLNDTLSRKEKHDFFDVILGDFAEHKSFFQKYKFDIKAMDYELITPEICIVYIYYYVSECDYYFTDIPGVMADAEICEYAFHVNQSVIRHIPVDYITDEMLKKIPASRKGFFMIPEQVRSKKICRTALLDAKGNPKELFRVLKEIPAPHMNRDIMMLYLEYGGLINHEFNRLALPDGWEKQRTCIEKRSENSEDRRNLHRSNAE